MQASASIAHTQFAMTPRMFSLRAGNQVLPLHDQMVVGRSPVCDVVFVDDAKMSRLHARFSMHDEGALVEDLQSSNGVFVNGLRINGRAVLHPGDTVQLGSQRLVVEDGDSAPRARAVTRPDLPAFRPNTLPAPAFDGPEPMTERAIPAVPTFDWQPLRDALKSEELERAAILLRVAFDRMLDEASLMGRLPPHVQHELCDHALVMVSKTGDGFWLNMLFHLHMLLAQPLPHAVAAVLPQLVHDARGLDTLALDAYVKVLRRGREQMTPVERRLCVAIESALLIASSNEW